MAHTLDTSATIAAATTNPVTKAYTCGAGTTVLVLAIAWKPGTRTGTPTYNGIALTQADITRKYVTSPEGAAELWYLLAPPTGESYTISIPNSEAVSIWGAVVTFMAQVGYGTALDVATGITGITLNPSLAPSASIAGDVMVEVLADGVSSVPTGRTHTSLATQDWGQYVAAIQYGLIAGSGTVTAGFTIAADDWGMVVALFKELVIPAAPSNAHEDSKTDVQIVMGWTDNSNNETGFKVFRDGILITTIAAGATQYTFTGLSGGITYDLAVKATNGGVDSEEAQLTDATIANSVVQLNIGDVMKQVDTKTVGVIQINIGDVWKNVVGMQINIADIWKSIFSLGYYGTATALSAARMRLAAVTINNYALFGGGDTGYGTYFATVDAYDASLTRTTPTALSVARFFHAVATVGDYALFGGGEVSAVSAVVDAYDITLTRTTPTVLSVARYELDAATVGNYALFGGGNVGGGIQSAVVDAYDTSLVRTTPTALSVARDGLAAATIGTHALFVAGFTTTAYSAVVDAYDTSLVRTTPTASSVARSGLAAATIGNYALFGGGSANGSLAVVDAYNTSLTRTTPTSLSVARWGLAATTVGDYALFGGGNIVTGTDSDVVDAYNTTLTRTIPAALSVARRYLAATTVGNYALFGGGNAGGSVMSAVVDVYTT